MTRCCSSPRAVNFHHGEEGRDVDVRNKVEHALPYKKVYITAQLDPLRRLVHLKGSSRKLSNDE